jgi:hypothetical protein
MNRIVQLVLLLLMGSPAWAAITMVQYHGVAVGSATSVTNSFSSNTAAGNLLIACTDYEDSVNFVSISDSQGNALIQFGTEVDNTTAGIKSRCYYSKNIVGGADTITVAVSAKVAIVSYIHEVSGADRSAPLDQSCTASNTANSISCTVTTTIASEIVFGYAYNFSTATAGTGFTTDLTTNQNVTEHRIVTAAGSYIISANLSSTGGGILIAGTFKAPLQFFFKRREDP